MERKYQAYIQKLLSSDALRGDSIPTLDEYVKREMQGIGYEQIGEMYQIVHEHAKILRTERQYKWGAEDV